MGDYIRLIRPVRKRVRTPSNSELVAFALATLTRIGGGTNFTTFSAGFLPDKPPSMRKARANTRETEDARSRTLM